jgi:hypothetical protein
MAVIVSTFFIPAPRQRGGKEERDIRLQWTNLERDL